MEKNSVAPQKKVAPEVHKSISGSDQDQIAATPEIEELPQLVQRAKLNPALLKPTDLLQLQRTLGNSAVLQLMRSGAGSASASASANQTNKPPMNISKADKKAIQRLIGFEIETRIPIYKEVSNALTRPGYNSVHVNAGTGDGTEVSVDKKGATSIIELVTAPVDDSQISKNFKATAQNWVKALTNLHTEAIKGPPPKKMKPTIAAADDSLQFGFTDTDDDSKKDMIAVQVTHGIRLDKVDTLFKQTSIPKANQARGADQLKSDSMAEVGPAMDIFMPNLEGIIDPATIITKKAERVQALKEVRGFFSLLAQYLISGGKAKTYYLKNHTMLFYKSKMNNVLMT